MDPIPAPADVTPPASRERTKFNPSRRFIFAFSSICIITLAAALDSSSFSIALPVITARLHGTAIQAFWSGTASILASGIVQPIFGGLSHVFGRKQLVISSGTLFGIGSLMAALAPDFAVLLAGRTIQGLGTGGILVMGKIIITDMVPLAVRGAWFAYLNVVWALATVAGPFMGGGFAEIGYWRGIFWTELPIDIIGAITIVLFLKVQQLPYPLLSRIPSFDWFGSFLFITSCVSFLMPVTWGGVLYSWHSWHTLVPLIIGAAGILAFGYYEYWLSRKAFDLDGHDNLGDHIQPIIRFSIFRNWTSRLLYLQTFFHGLVLWSVLYFLPLYYQAVKGYRPVITGAALLPETLLIAPMSVIVGTVSSKTGKYRWAIFIGWGLTTVGFGLLHQLDIRTTVPAHTFLNFPISIGTGMCFNSLTLGVQAAARPVDASHSITFYNFIRVFGQAVGVAISGVIFQNEFRRRLLESPLLASKANEYTLSATALASLIHKMDADSVATAHLVQAFAHALKTIWVAMAVLSGIMLVSTWFVKAYSLEQKLETNQGFAGDEQTRVSKDESRGLP